MKTMKKTLNMMLAMMAGAMAFTACSSDDILENIENNEVVENASQLKPMTFTAVQEGEGGTRAAIDGLSINWTAGDKISIFDGATENAGVQMFELATGENTTSATFTGDADPEASTYYALYPYAVGETLIPVTKDDAVNAFGEPDYIFEMNIEETWNRYYDMDPEIAEDRVKNMFRMYDVSEENQAIILAYLKGESIGTPGVQLDGSSIKNVVIPAEQTATAGSADPQAMIMVAKGSDKDDLEFKNVCAYVKVTPQFDCTAICLKSNGAENLAGKMTVNYNDGDPTTTVTADGTNTVYLVGTISAGSAYYIAVRPEALTSGFTIEFLTADTYYARSTNKTLDLARSNVKNLGVFTTSGTWTISSPTSGNDGAGHDWMLLTPTLKIAVISTPSFDDYVTFDNVPSWGADWVLPSAADFAELYNNGCISYKNDNGPKVTWRGLGILKYKEGFTWENNPVLWSSTPDPDNSDRQMALWTYNGTIQGADKTVSRFYIFKYTK